MSLVPSRETPDDEVAAGRRPYAVVPSAAFQASNVWVGDGPTGPRSGWMRAPGPRDRERMRRKP